MESKSISIAGQEKLIVTSPLVEVTRTFRAPVERVWKAWSDPEMAKQWWGPENFSCPEAKIDFRVGGKYLLAMKDPSGKLTWSTGEYQDIAPLKKIVATDAFSDKDGNMISANDAGMPGEWGDVSIATVEFESVSAEETKMSLVHEGIPAEMHDDCVKGWDSSFDKLERLVQQN